MNEAHKDSPTDLAGELRAAAAAMKRLLAGGLTRSAVVTLIADDTGISKRTVSQVLDAAATFEKHLTAPRAG